MYGIYLGYSTWHFATAKVIIVDNAFFPVHAVRHREETQVVQVWHAAGAMKRFGYSTLKPGSTEYRFLHKNYDWVIASSSFAADCYALAFRTPRDRVVPLGAPRMDFFLQQAEMDKSSELLRKRFPLLKGKRVLLYAPTFRGNGVHKHEELYLEARLCRQKLPDDWILVFKPHPMLKSSVLEGCDICLDAKEDINPWLALADAFITDYSSSIIEFAVLGRPMALLTPDLKQYKKKPGFYFNFEKECVGTLCHNMDELLEWQMEMPPITDQKYEAFIKKQFGNLDGHNGERVAAFIHQLVVNDGEVSSYLQEVLACRP